MHPARLTIDELLADCEEVHTRRGGPGGQHRNKVSTAVVLRHRPTGLRAEASERRSRTINRAAAIHRLRLRLATEWRSARPTVGGPAVDPSPHGASPGWQGPSSLWIGRRKGSTIRVSVDHQDYPALVAEALDRLEEAGGRVSDAARRLGVSGSQLQRLLARHPAVWEALQTLRHDHGLSPLACPP